MAFILKDFLNELEELVNIDSGTYSLGGIEAVANLMQKKYLQLGWHVKQINCEKAGFGLEVRNKPNQKEIDILFIGHMDTVFPEGTVAKRPFSIGENQAYGPGVSDMKAGLLSLFYAFKELPVQVLDTLSLCVCMNPDEEVGSLHSEKWLQSVAQNAKQVIIAEPGRSLDKFVKARKGMAQFQMTFHGKASHAGNELLIGKSAVTEMAHWILYFNQLSNHETGTTFNVGVAHGGLLANVVPDLANIVIDVRYWDYDDFINIEQSIREKARNSHIEGVQIEFIRNMCKPPMIPSEKTNSFIHFIEQEANKLSIKPTWLEVGGVSDGNLTSCLGIPTLDGFGPAGGACHGVDEYLDLDTIEPRIVLIQNIIKNLAKHNETSA